MAIQPNFKRPFVTFVKKQHKPFQAVIEDEVNTVCQNPLIGEMKQGDLTGIRVHKFRHQKKEWLMAYFVDADGMENGLENRPQFILIDFYQIGSHENFYDDLKSYLRSSGWYK